MYLISALKSRNLKLSFLLVFALLVFPFAAMADKEKDFTSSFLKEVLKEKYEEAKDPTKEDSFKWAFFDPRKVYKYSYKQTMHSIVTMTFTKKARAGYRALRETKQQLQQNGFATGVIRVKSNGNFTGRIELENLEVTSQHPTISTFFQSLLGFTFKTNIGKTVFPKILLGKIKENGSPVIVKHEGKLLFTKERRSKLSKLLFPLPLKPLKLGESIDITFEVPSENNTSSTKGKGSLILSKYVRIEGRTCAKFVLDFSMSGLETFEQSSNSYFSRKVDYRSKSKGKSIFYFDLQKRRFVSGKLAMVQRATQVKGIRQDSSPPSQHDTLIEIDLIK